MCGRRRLGKNFLSCCSIGRVRSVTVKDIFWTQGRYDIVIVIEAADELSATALNLSLSGLGNIRTESLFRQQTC
jgi:uncharacterized protein with GYD domain